MHDDVDGGLLRHSAGLVHARRDAVEPAQGARKAVRRLEAQHSGDEDYDDYTRGKGDLLRELAPVWTAWAAAQRSGGP